MAEAVFIPRSARADGARIILTNGADNTLALVMPNADGASFCAAALDSELKRARRPGE